MLSRQRVCLWLCEREREARYRADEQGTGNRRAGIWPRGVNVRAGARADFSRHPPHPPSATEPDQNQKSRHRAARSTSDCSQSLATLKRQRETKKDCLF
ncbi:hypothetical protein QQF64_032512 [Cirrhinus molitorella]|uniref:Uncharacterized protein n=1 Tax=Cirrhinus molitorella TaxID=172907 RepID=A0ABR3N019_9TELE